MYQQAKIDRGKEVFLDFAIFEDDRKLIYKNSTFTDSLKWIQFVRIFSSYVKTQKTEFNKQTEDYINEKLENCTHQITQHLPISNELLQELTKEAEKQRITVAYLALKICVSYIISNKLHMKE